MPVTRAARRHRRAGDRRPVRAVRELVLAALVLFVGPFTTGLRPAIEGSGSTRSRLAASPARGLEVAG